MLLKDKVNLIKVTKEYWIKETDTGDIPPHVIVEKGGFIWAVIVSPKVDRDDAIKAAAFCKTTFSPDKIHLVLDAHMKSFTSNNGEDKEEFEKRAREEMKGYKKGDFQRMCNEENACELGIIQDCIIWQEIDKGGKSCVMSLPYYYHGKGSKFEWRYDEKDIHFMDVAEGVIVEAMANAEPSDAVKMILEAGSSVFKFSEERRDFHIARAILQVLEKMEYTVIDFISARHPEWLN